jgi:predicted transposase/invertase (TIGR01784 family)
MLEHTTPSGIDPRVDVVFTWLMGDPAHEDLRIDFLNAVLGPGEPPITSARTLNPMHPASMLAEREMRVDVEVTDATGRIYQIEMQRQTRRGLHQRMLYGWARLYAGQVRESAEYHDLKPVVGIWICEQDPFPTSNKAYLQFRVTEREEQLPHPPDLRIDVLQLSRVPPVGAGLADEKLGRWCRFFNEAAGWRTIPAEVYTPVLEHAMKAIDTFRSDPERNAIYQARINYQLERSAELAELEDARAELESAVARAEAAEAAAEAAEAAAALERAAKEAALAELEALRAKLAAGGS